ncbi:MAG: DUF1194 domain-containing protein [Hyphomicrobiales bacterium]|nr:DUF1194 domain-containing protein [Hyphomicrobiales bacterium]
MRLRAVLALFALASLLAPNAPARAQPVDLLLVLAADVSRSVDHAKFMLQREGYAAAVSNPQVLDAIRSGPHGRIALIFLEWSGVAAQKVVIDWTTIDGPAAARRFGDQLVEAPRPFADRTSISGAIEFSLAQFDRAPFSATRRTIDISGDGTNNAGRDVRAARDEAVAQGVTINGLVILTQSLVPWNPEHTNPPGGLEKYFRDNVTGGPGSFVMAAEGFETFGRAIVKKMIAEIALLALPARRF